MLPSPPVVAASNACVGANLVRLGAGAGTHYSTLAHDTMAHDPAGFWRCLWTCSPCAFLFPLFPLVLFPRSAACVFCSSATVCQVRVRKDRKFSTPVPSVLSQIMVISKCKAQTGGHTRAWRERTCRARSVCKTYCHTYTISTIARRQASLRRKTNED